MNFSGNKSLGHDNLSIRLSSPPNVDQGTALPIQLTPLGAKRIRQLGKDLKFSLCLEEEDVAAVIKPRLLDWGGAASITSLPVVLKNEVAEFGDLQTETRRD